MERDRVCPTCKRDPMTYTPAPSNHSNTDRTPLLASGGGASAAASVSAAASAPVVDAGSINAEEADQMV